jgi:uncharacterized membrane protein
MEDRPTEPTERRRDRRVRTHRINRILAAVAGACAVLTVAGLLALWPRGDQGEDVLGELGVTREVHDARVTGTSVGPCAGTGPDAEIRCRLVELVLLSGPDEGDGYHLEFPDIPASPDLAEGDAVVLAIQRDAPAEFRYAYVDRQRKAPLFWLAVAFAVAVVALGRLRGVAALAGLVASFVILLKFILPALLHGTDPLLVSVVGAAAIAFVALYLAHGFSAMTTVALLGTLGALAITAALGSLATSAARFSGFGSEEALLVNIGAANVDLAGLILAGVVIGALGAIDDMTVTQASAVWELRAANPGFSRGRLLRSGLRIGSDHVASTVNTLFLAYAGASLPLLLLFVLSRQSLGTVANGEVVATEIVRSLVGSIGLVAAVPLTTWLAVLARPREIRRSPTTATRQASGGSGAESAAEPTETPRGIPIPNSRVETWMQAWLDRRHREE